jgi:hypothetical protein
MNAQSITDLICQAEPFMSLPILFGLTGGKVAINVSENIFFMEHFFRYTKKSSSAEPNLFLKCSEKQVTTSADDADVGGTVPKGQASC